MLKEGAGSPPQVSSAGPRKVAKRPFLRKGQGLARWQAATPRNGETTRYKANSDQTTSDAHPGWDAVLESPRQVGRASTAPAPDNASEASSHITPSQWDMKEADEKRDLEEFRLLELAAAASRSLKNSPSRHNLSASGANARTNGRGFQATGRSPPHPRGGADPSEPEVSGSQPGNGYGLSDAVGRYAAQNNDLFTGLDQSPSETRDASESPETEALWSQSPNPTKNLSHFDDLDSWGDDGSEENDNNDVLGEDASGTAGEEGGPANVAKYGGECERARVRACSPAGCCCTTLAARLFLPC